MRGHYLAGAATLAFFSLFAVPACAVTMAVTRSQDFET
jgi:hypothetical protein